MMAKLYLTTLQKALNENAWVRTKEELLEIEVAARNWLDFELRKDDSDLVLCRRVVKGDTTKYYHYEPVCGVPTDAPAVVSDAKVRRAILWLKTVIVDNPLMNEPRYALEAIQSPSLIAVADKMAETLKWIADSDMSGGDQDYYGAFGMVEAAQEALADYEQFKKGE